MNKVSGEFRAEVHGKSTRQGATVLEAWETITAAQVRDSVDIILT